MIKKIIKIKWVGKYENFIAQWVGDIEFKKHTLIYGDNWHGKTTLSNILTSLKENKSDIIFERRSFWLNSWDIQEISILLEDWIKLFENYTWNWKVDNIEIFDSFFVADNIYSGFNITNDQWKWLYVFALGKEAVVLAKEVEKIKDLIQYENSQIRLCKESIQKYINSEFMNYNFDDFLSLGMNNNIDKELEKIEKDIKNSLNSNEINEEIVFLENLELINFDNFIGTLEKLFIFTISTISERYISTYKTYESSFINKGINIEKWFSDGIDLFIKNSNNCPFCNQKVENSSIIESYSNYFNDEYKKLTKDIESIIKNHAMKDISLTDLIIEINKKTVNNSSKLGKFEKYFDNKDGLLEITDLSILKESFGKIKSKLQEKQKNVLDKIAIKCLDDFRSIINQISEDFIKYNYNITIINNNIKAFKEQLIDNQGDIDGLKTKLKILKLQKLKEHIAVKEFILSYKKSEQEKEYLNKQLKRKKYNLQVYNTENIKEYANNTNHYLKLLNSNISIKCNIKYNWSSKLPVLNFNLMIDWNLIWTKFKYCLSEWDKNTLALAFFFARLKADKNIKDKIVVVDDPITSLDRKRRNKTIDTISSFALDCKQLILLSHNDKFLYEFKKKIEWRWITDLKVLKISYWNIGEFDIDSELKNKYFKLIDEIEFFLDNPGKISSSDKIKNLIRCFLEDTIKYRYYKDIRETRWLGSMIRKLKLGDSEFKEKKSLIIEELNSLNEYSRSGNHGDSYNEHINEWNNIDESFWYLKQCYELVFLRM